MQFSTVFLAIAALASKALAEGHLEEPSVAAIPITGRGAVAARAGVIIDAWDGSGFTGLKFQYGGSLGTCYSFPSDSNNIISSAKADAAGGAARCTIWQNAACQPTETSFSFDRNGANIPSPVNNAGSSFKCTA